MTKEQISTEQYATVHKNLWAAKLSGLLEYKAKANIGGYEAGILRTEIKHCENWIYHYNCMITGEEEIEGGH